MTGAIGTLWLESLAMTAMLIAAVLVVRRPVAVLFGPRIAYGLWLIPLLRLVLPPLPGGVTVVSAPAIPAADRAATGAMQAENVPSAPLFDMAMLVDALPFIWFAGFAGVLALVLYRHRRWLSAMLAEATPLESIGRVRLVMSKAVDGPVATGLVRPLVAVPTDFFARYSKAERALAIEHELAHHRAGDLWANAAALVVLAAQWFNPLAWWALGAFRFDQEAACDARILGAVAAPERPAQAHHYARAIAKSLAGPRLLLAAPMTSGRGVKERLHMLTKEPQGGLRPMLGRMLLGGGAVTALALTISTLPDEVVFAAEPAAEAPAAPVEKRERSMLFVTTGDGDSEASADGVKREVRRVVIHDGERGEGKPRKLIVNGEEIELPDGAAIAREVQSAMPFFGLDEDDLRAALADQGIKGKKADAVIAKLRQQRGDALRKQFTWSEAHARRAEAMAEAYAKRAEGLAEAHAARAEAHAKRAEALAEADARRAIAVAPCAPGQGNRVMVNSSSAGGSESRVRMISCGGAELPREKQVEAMKKARDRLAAEKDGQGMGADIRAQMVADLDKAIAELEAEKQ